MRPKTTTASKPVIGPVLRRLIDAVLILFALLGVNSAYLGAISLSEYLGAGHLQDYFYLLMFLAHLVLGLILAPLFLLFGALHLRRAWVRPNRYAVRAGLALYLTGVAVIVSGLVLTRFGFLEIDDPRWRGLAYWLHIAAPLVAAWLFVLHRLAGRPLRWRTARLWGGVAAVFAVGMLALHLSLRPPTDERILSRFSPALTVLEDSDRIPARHLMRDDHCAACHGDIAGQVRTSMHHFSSFDNPAYRLSIMEARTVLGRRDGHLDNTRLCAACHDPVPLLDGRFTRADFDPDRDRSAHAGITCVVCHAVKAIENPKRNGAYRIIDPPRYPFAFSDNPLLKAINHQLIKAKPELHKQSFLKPLHRSAEFCATCHKVHLPQAVNHYRWLRGQDHYDSFLSSGVSGHRVDSFYYPAKAVDRCANCHMPLRESDDPAARDFAGSGGRQIHDHGFAAANTGVPHLLGLPRETLQARRGFLANAARVDLFGLRLGTDVDAPLVAPLRPEVPTLKPGGTYLLEAVVRTLGVGHQLTQGTADSNQLWLQVEVRDGRRIVATSGALTSGAGEVDPWAWFCNAYLLDRNGRRIDRRNGQDIFVALYNHQIPPGAAAVVHYRLKLPARIEGPLEVRLRLNYRKFDTAFLRHLRGDSFQRNDLPIVTLASDRVLFPVKGRASPQEAPAIPVWERWNDYGIGLLRQGTTGSTKGALRQAEAAFTQVQRLGRADGPLNLARAYFKEGRLDDAARALREASRMTPPAPAWTVAWYAALIAHQRGDLKEANRLLNELAETRFPEARRRGFDFSRDVRVWNELGRVLFDRSRRLRGAKNRAARLGLLRKSVAALRHTLAIDPENGAAHFNLALAYEQLGEPARAAEHRRLHEKYRPDDTAVAQAVARHRARNPAADHAANPIAVYDLAPTEPLTASLAKRSPP